MMAAIAYLVLQLTIVRTQGPDSVLSEAIGRDWKGKLSLLLYVVSIGMTLRSARIAQAILVMAALIWLIPDRRIEKRLAVQPLRPDLNEDSDHNSGVPKL
jgi:hypothetical protein